MKVVLLPTRVLAVVVECVLIYDIEPVAFVNLNSVKELPLLFPIEVDVGATLLRNDTFPNNFVPAGCNSQREVSKADPTNSHCHRCRSATREVRRARGARWVPSVAHVEGVALLVRGLMHRGIAQLD